MVGAPPTRVLQFSNINAQLYGVDFETGYRITDNWRLDGGLNYVRGERVGSTYDNLYRIAPLNGRAQITFEHSGWMAAVEGVFYSNQNKVSEFNDEEKSPSYALMNVRGSYEPYKGVLIALGLENAFDNEVTNHLAGTNRVRNNEDLAPGNKVPGQGRNVYTTLTLSW
jgi:iron complex outermembrane receptor protein